MVTKVTVSLPDSLYQRAQRFAELHQQEMEEAISALIEQGLAADGADEEFEDWTEPEPAVDREREAYVAMHSQLKEQHLSQYVAFVKGKFVDHDDDAAMLVTRVKAKFPGEFVWMTQVRQEPMRTIVVRSPRIVRDKVS